MILELRFEGLLHYVLNEDVSKKVRLCVVLSKAAGHTGKISADSVTTLGNADPDGVAIDGQRAFIQFSPVTAGFDFEGPVIGGTRRLKGALPIEGIIGNSADKNLEIVRATPSATVRSQFLIGEGGTFALTPSSGPPQLELPANSLNGQVSTLIDFAERFTMVVPNVSSARLIILPLTDSVTPVATYDITTTGATASLTLSHTCFSTGNPRQIGDPDVDFRFHYMMLASLPSGFPRLQDMPVPIIRNFSHEVIRPDGCDCAGTRAVPRPYDLDKFV